MYYNCIGSEVQLTKKFTSPESDSTTISLQVIDCKFSNSCSNHVDRIIGNLSGHECMHAV